MFKSPDLFESPGWLFELLFSVLLLLLALFYMSLFSLSCSLVILLNFSFKFASYLRRWSKSSLIFIIDYLLFCISLLMLVILSIPTLFVSSLPYLIWVYILSLVSVTLLLLLLSLWLFILLSKSFRSLTSLLSRFMSLILSRMFFSFWPVLFCSCLISSSKFYFYYEPDYYLTEDSGLTAISVSFFD